MILDTRHDGRTGILMVANAHNIQYDSVLDDASGNEDASPDFYWASAAKITSKGWVLEMRIPFSSLRYKQADPQTWGIMLYRNYPRDRHYHFSTPAARCGYFVCHSNVLTGLRTCRPAGTWSRPASPPARSGAARFVRTPPQPLARASRRQVDAERRRRAGCDGDTISRRSVDTAQIATNQRFALFFRETPVLLEASSY